MQIQVLGPIEITDGKDSWSLSSKRVSTLLALLALFPGAPVPVDELVDELWGDKHIANERNALQANVTRLRKFLAKVAPSGGGELVSTVGSGYLLAVPADAVDSHRFLRLADRGAGLVQREPAEAIGVLREALALWRGPALLDVCEGFRCRVRAAHLEERRLTAYEDLTFAELAVGVDRVSVPELRQLAAEHSERERLSELLMMALYRDGRQTEALEVFHGMRRRLSSELGLEPGRSLHRVYEAILNQDATLGEPWRMLVSP